MNLRKELEDLDKALKDMIETTRADWIREQRHRNPDLQFEDLIPPEQAQTADGRPLLADLLVARAHVLAALATMPKDM